MKKACIAFIGFCLLLPCWAAAQELVYDEAIKVGYDAVYCRTPVIVFNGKEHGVFYYWSGKEDHNAGLHFRRLDENAQPIGPQKLVFASEQGYGYVSVAAAWDGEAYIVVFAPSRTTKLFIFRVSTKGEILAQQTMAKERNEYLFIEQIFVIGEKVFLFLEKLPYYYYDTYLAQVDRKLTKPIKEKRIVAGGLKHPIFCGVTHDADKFVMMLGEYGPGGGSGYKIINPCILHVDFTGKVIKFSNVPPIIQNIMNRTSPADGITDNVSESWWVGGPVSVGDGFIVFVSRLYGALQDGSILPYFNQTFKIDEDGNILGGPFNAGGEFYLYGSGHLVGNHAAFWCLDVMSGNEFLILFGRKGAHIGNSYYSEAHSSFDSVSFSGQAYTGMANTFVYYLKKYGGQVYGCYSIYANQYRMPEFSKPGFFYFKAGTAEPVKNHRLVMWSVVLGKNVTLTGPHFELKDLPPVWSYLVDTKGQKTKLTLSFTTEDGQTKKKRLVINP